MVPQLQGVDKSKFKTCEQSSFCQRNRNHKAHEQLWKLDLSTIKEVDNTIFATITDDSSNINLVLVMSLTAKGALRLKIDQLGATRARFEALAALNPSLQFQKLQMPTITSDTASYVFGSISADSPHTHYTLKLTSKPFKAEVYNYDGILIVALNSKGLMRFETHKLLESQTSNQDLFGQPKLAQAFDEAGRPLEEVSTPPPNQEETLDPKEESTAVSYSESFSSFVDSRPHGPMSVGLDVHFPHSDHLYGIPEHADSFLLKDTRPNIRDPYRLYNVDIFEYELNSPMSLYGAIPFMIAQSKDVGSFGILWLNAAETWIDIESNESQQKNAGVVGMLSNLVKSDSKMTGKLAHWFSETGLIDVWLIPGPDPITVMKYNAEILGTMPMPPVYSTGFHQCRWNYFSTKEVMQVERKYDEVEVPLDALWLDIEYTEGRSKKYFTWDPVAFADHIQMAKNLTANGRRLIAIIDPHIKKEDGYSCYEEGKQYDYWIKDVSNHPYEAWCWPGASYWPDYLSPAVQQWWATKFSPEHFPGDSTTSVDIWNDMNEPSVFSGPEVTAPRDLLHVDGWEHRDIHNMYGFFMTKATYDGLVKYRSNLNRPFILTRSFFAGSQRYAAAWTGDNQARWDHLKISVPMLLSLSVAGMPFVGADVGGFFNNPESDELVIRWHQAGALQPFFRNHAHHDAKHREIYKFSGQTLDLLRNALQLRYSYAPYIYTLFHEAHSSGVPLMRPCWLHESLDEKTFDLEEQYYLGYALLVRPVMDKGVKSVPVYLPGHQVNWYDMNNHIMLNSGSTIDYLVDISTVPLFQRAGTIVPRKYRMRKSLELAAFDPITLDIVLSKNDGKLFARGQVFIDDTKSLNDDENNSTIREIVFYDEVIFVKSSTQARLLHSAVERIVIYNWPSDKKIKSIVAATEKADYKDARRLDFQLDVAKQDGSMRIDIKKPQQSVEWTTWMIKFEFE